MYNSQMSRQLGAIPTEAGAFEQKANDGYHRCLTRLNMLLRSARCAYESKNQAAAAYSATPKTSAAVVCQPGWTAEARIFALPNAPTPASTNGNRLARSHTPKPCFMTRAWTSGSNVKR